MTFTDVRAAMMAMVVSSVGSVALAAGGGLDPFKTEESCTGTFMPGASVPYTLNVEDRAGQSHAITYTLEILTPTGQLISLASGSYTIGVNEDWTSRRRLSLPGTAPNGRYSLRMTGESTAWTSADTCSFHVQ